MDASLWLDTSTPFRWIAIVIIIVPVIVILIVIIPNIMISNKFIAINIRQAELAHHNMTPARLSLLACIGVHAQ